MDKHLSRLIAAIVVAGATPAFWCATSHVVGAQTNDEAVSSGGAVQPLELTPAQKNSIYNAVREDKGRVSPMRFSTAVGAEVPPMIELYMLPDDVLAANPAAKFYKYTMVQDQVVLVDPTHMRVIDVIGPKTKR
jgi:Protein of unknown function (DUF1236)